MENKKVTLNKEQELYVITCGKNSFSVFGFEVLFNKVNKLADEIGKSELKVKRKGTLKVYNNYQKLIKIVSEMNKKNGFKSKSELIPEFIGKEGYRVEVIDKQNEKRRFIIGKSTGFIPCHLEILKSNSFGGGSVHGYPFKSIKFIEKVY